MEEEKKCEHKDTTVFTVCCGAEAKNYNETTLCPTCKDHTGFERICDDCNEVVEEV